MGYVLPYEGLGVAGEKKSERENDRKEERAADISGQTVERPPIWVMRQGEN